MATGNPTLALTTRILRSSVRLAHADLSLDILALVAFPFVLMLFTSSWTFLVTSGDIDPYIYTGYFLDLKHYLHVFPNTYYGSRLPWLLLGNAVYAVASPSIANLILRFLLFYGAIFSVYTIVRLVWKDRLVATISAIALGVNSYFLAAITWDYIDGPGIVGILLTLVFLTAATRTRFWPAMLFCAGAAGLTAVSIQIFLVAVMPSAVAWYVLMNARTLKNSLLGSAICAAAGALTAFAFYGAINEHLVGNFNYLKPQIDAAKGLDASPYHHTHFALRDTAAWPWLALPAVGIVISVGLLLVAARYYLPRRRLRDLSDAHAFGAIAAVPMLMAASVFLYYELTDKGSPLQYNFYASYLIPFSLIAIGAALALGLSRLPGRWRLPAGAIAVVCLLIPFLLGALGTEPRFPAACSGCSLTGWRGVLIAATGLLLVLAALLRRTPLVLLALVSITGLNLAALDSDVVYFSGQEQQHERFLMIYDANSALAPYNDDGQLRFWYSSSEPLIGVYRAVSSLHLWGYRLISENFPRLTVQNQVPLRVGQRAAILTTGGDPVPLIDPTLEDGGLEAEVVGRTVIKRGPDAFNLYIVRAVPRGPSLALGVPVGDFLPTPGAEIDARPNGDVIITTQITRWSYAAILNVGDRIETQFSGCPGVVRIRARSVIGHTGLGVLKKDRSDWVEAQPVDAGGTFVDIFLTIPRMDDTSDLVAMNWDANGVGVIDIRSVTVSLLSVGACQK